MRNAAGQPIGGANLRHVPLGAGGQLIKFSQSTDGATMVVAADIHGAYVKGASDTAWRALFLSTAIPLGLQHDDGSWDGTYNDHSGCADVVVAPSDATRIYMIYDGYLLKSSDTGASFTNTGMTRFPFWSNGMGTKAFGHSITVDPNNANVILFGTRGQSVWYSTNGGTSFTSLSVAAASVDSGDQGFPAAHLTACDPTSTQSGGIRQTWYYTRLGTGVYRSTTGPGGTYSLMNTTGMPTNPSSLTVDAFGTLWVTQYGSVNNVWKWTSGGGWVNLNISSGDQFWHVAVDPANANRIVVDNGGRYFMSTNGGTTWPNRWGDDFSVLDQVHREKSLRYLDVGTAKHFHPVANHLQFDNAVAGRLWAAWGSSVSYCDLPASSATKLTWIGIGEGIEEFVAHCFCAIPGGRRFVGGWDMGCFDIQSLTRPVNPQKIAYATSEVWGQTQQPVIQQPCSCIDYAADDPNYVAFMQHGGWFTTPINAPHMGFSSDGGATLQPFPVAPPHKPFSNGGGSLVVGNAGQVMVFWNVNAMATRTKNGGTSWSDINIPGFPADGVENGVEWQGNGGYFLNKFPACYDKTGGAVYHFNYGPPTATTIKGLWKTTDFGDNWTHVNSTSISKASGSLTSNYVYSLHLRSVPDNAGHLFLTAGMGTGDSLMRSTDGGVTWSECTANSGQVIKNVSDVGFGKHAPGKTYPAIYFWGQVNSVYGLYRSDDNLTTTKLLSAKPANALDYPMVVAGDPDVYGRVWLCMSGNGVIVGDYQDQLTLAA
jgi:hypothetical protein